MQLKIIQLGKTHLKACIELDQKSFQGLWTISQWERELTDSKRICLGALDNNSQKLLGLCSSWIVSDEFHITALAVDPQHFRKGIGTLVMSKLIRTANEKGISRIKLEVKDTNEAAKALYKCMKFKIEGYRPNFYKDGSNALIYIKNLANNS
tara:strand:+ start:68 stop:523 length:456 start_codon:yes stop_codon:yes gene_type:complete